MAEEAVVVEQPTTESGAQETPKTPTIDEAVLLARQKPATPVAEKEKPAETILPAEVTIAKEEVKDTPQGKDSTDDFGQNDFNIDEIIQSLESEEQPGTQAKVETPVKDNYTVKDIASLFKVEADSLEGIQKAIEAKAQLQAQSVTDETKPIRDLENLIALDDKSLLTQLKLWEGYTDEEVSQYLGSLEESQGKAGIRNMALDTRVNLRKGLGDLKQQIADKQAQHVGAQKQYETDIRSRINKMDTVFGVPVSKEDNDAFASEILNKSYDQQFKDDPDKYLSAMRLVRDFAKIKESVFKSGAKAGAKQMKQVYESKLHNKDLGANVRGGKPLEEKEKTVDSNVDAAQREIRSKRGIVRPA